MAASWRRWQLGLGCFLVMGGAIAFSGDGSLAQILPDNTLPVNSIVTPQGNTHIITGGSVAGSNLFHSFGQFSVPTGGTAFFNNALNIQNILTRVTGGSISNIDGLIKANGTANLFLLNPNGIIFGSNASLNIGGSFLATTANALGFGEQGVFSATTANNPSVLTVEPTALFLNQLAANSISSQASLEVPSGRSLLLVGGNVQLDGGQLLAPGGRVELAGVQGSSIIPLNVNGSNLRLTFPEGVALNDVYLTNGAGVNVRSGGGGSIAINARNLNILGASNLRAGIDSGLGSVNSRAGDIEINADEAIRLTNESFIANTVQPRGIGKAGDIFITTGEVLASGGAYLITSTFGRGDAGNININARDTVSLDGQGVRICPCGGAFSRVESAETVGQGGQINITTDILRVVNGTTLSVSTNGRGNAGSVNINARDAEFSGVGDDGFSGGASSTVRSRGVGEGGSINITARSLSVTNGAVLTASTFGAGPGGRIQINAADSVNLSGVGKNIQSSGLFISTTQMASGQGGQITVNTDLFRIADGAVVDAQAFNFSDGGGITINANNFEAVNGGQVISTTRSSGKAGNITINATNSIVLTGTDATFTDRLARFGPVIVDNVSASSGLFANTLPESTGDGSSILVNSGQRIVITAGAGIAVNSEGLGNTGNVELKSPNITLDGNAYLSATTSSGDRGNIILQSENIQLRHGSNITTNASNNANGGNIAIDTGTLVALEDSDIRANAIRGQGGNIQLTALGIFRAGESDIDASSQLGINGIVQISRLDDPSRSLVPFEVNLASETATEFTGCTAGGTQAQGSLYVTGSGGLPPNPVEALNNNPILDDLGSSAPPAIVEARTLVKTPDGRLLLVAEIPHTCR